ncbi:MAG: AI-2E family transporter [Actinobacteria bacterium]|nr:AI-2E family transporter [Actinomycetota bacterium]
MTHTSLHISPRSILRSVVIVGAYLLVITVAMRAATTLVWFLEACVFAALSWPVVQKLHRHMSNTAAILLITALLALSVSAIAALGLTELQGESAKFQRNVPAAVRDLEGTEGLGSLIKKLQIADDIERFADQITNQVRFRNADVRNIASRVGEGASAVFVVWILTVMIIFTGPSMVNGAIDLAPETKREPIRWVLKLAYSTSAKYMGFMALQSLAVLLITFTVSTGLGIDLPGLLAVTAALLAFVPYVGIFAGALPLALLALLNGPEQALAVLVGAFILQMLDAYLVQRKVDVATVPVGIFPTMLAAMIGFSLRGPGGLLVGVALATMAMAVLSDTGAMRTIRSLDDEDLANGPVDPVAHESADSTNSAAMSSGEIS